MRSILLLNELANGCDFEHFCLRVSGAAEGRRLQQTDIQPHTSAALLFRLALPLPRWMDARQIPMCVRGDLDTTQGSP